MTKNLCFYSGPRAVSQWVSTFPLKLAQKHFYLFLQGILIHIPYIKVMPGYFEAFVLFAQAPDDKNSQAYTVGKHGCV